MKRFVLRQKIGNADWLNKCREFALMKNTSNHKILLDGSSRHCTVSYLLRESYKNVL